MHEGCSLLLEVFITGLACVVSFPGTRFRFTSPSEKVWKRGWDPGSVGCHGTIILFVQTIYQCRPYLKTLNYNFKKFRLFQATCSVLPLMELHQARVLTFPKYCRYSAAFNLSHLLLQPLNLRQAGAGRYCILSYMYFLFTSCEYCCFKYLNPSEVASLVHIIVQKKPSSLLDLFNIRLQNFSTSSTVDFGITTFVNVCCTLEEVSLLKSSTISCSISSSIAVVS